MKIEDIEFMTDEQVELLNADDIIYDFVTEKNILNENGNFEVVSNVVRDFDFSFIVEVCEKAFMINKDDYKQEVENILYEEIADCVEFSENNYDCVHDCLRQLQTDFGLKLTDEQYDSLFDEMFDYTFIAFPTEVKFIEDKVIDEIVNKLNKK